MNEIPKLEIKNIKVMSEYVDDIDVLGE